MNLNRVQLVIIAGLLPLAAHAASAPPEAWSVSTGVAAPAQASALRLNPATAPGRGHTAQLTGRYSTVTGGPISALEGLWDLAPLAFGLGGEYSVSTGNPELHAGAGLNLGSHGVGLSATVRRTAEHLRASAGVSTYSRWSDHWASGVRLDSLGEGRDVMEMAAGAVYHGLPWTGSRLECDLEYGLGSKLFTLRPAVALALPLNIASAIILDLPLRSLGAYAMELALGYEHTHFAFLLRASTALEGGAELMTRF